MNQNTIDKVRNTVTNNQFSTGGPMIGPVFSQEYIDRMRVLEQKYCNIRWLPLDLPKIELDDIEEFKDFWAKESVDTVRQKADVAEPFSKEEHPFGENSNWYVPAFKGLHLFQHELAPLSEHSWTGKLHTGNNKQLKRILSQVYEYFPIHTFTSVFIWQSTREIIPHQDQGAFWKCPTEFRVMLHDENPQPTLYVAGIEDGNAHYIDLPPDTNSFCWSNGTQLHGSDYHGKNKWLLVVAGVQHSIKCDELFERSIKKYKNCLNYELNL